MGEGKSTPGPWERNGRQIRLPLPRGGCSIAEVWGNMVNDLPNEETLANARLIAAAPTLLAACKDAREAHQILRDAPELNMSNYTEDEVAALNHARNEAFCKLEAISAAIAAVEQD